MGSANSNHVNEDGVFINKYGIQQKEVLEVVEYEVTSAKILVLGERPIAGSFDKAHLQDIHKFLFEDIYEWAGQQRDGISRKNYFDENGMRCRTFFCDPDEIDNVFSEVKTTLQATNNLKNIQSPEMLIETLTQIQQHLNHAHPFPEGNGRSLQVFMKQMVKESGHPFELDFNRVSKDEWNLANGQAAPVQFKYFGHEQIEKAPNISKLHDVFKQILVEQKHEHSINQKAVAQTIKDRLSTKFKEVSLPKKKPTQEKDR